MEYVLEQHSNNTGKSIPYRDGINPVYQVWTVKFADITEAQAETLRTFFATYGKVSSISWTPPGQTSSLLFRTTSDPKFTYIGYQQWDVDVALEQVFDYE